jgi:hypothetical protein
MHSSDLRLCHQHYPRSTFSLVVDMYIYFTIVRPLDPAIHVQLYHLPMHLIRDRLVLLYSSSVTHRLNQQAETWKWMKHHQVRHV